MIKFDYKKIFRSFRLNLVILFILGIFTSFSLEPYNIIIINFLTYPIFFIIFKIHSSKKIKAFLSGWSFGFGYFVSNLYWISYSLTYEEIFKPLIPLTIILVPAMLAIFYGSATLFSSFFRMNYNLSSILIFSVFLSITEYFRGVLFTGFPWNLISYSLTIFKENIQILSLIGTYSLNLLLITFFLFPIVILFNTSRKYKYFITSITISLAFLNYFYGAYKINLFSEISYKKLKTNISIVSPKIKLDRYFDNEDPAEKIKDLINLMQLQKDKITLFILPEGILAGLYLNDLKYYKNLFEDKINDNSYIILGINTVREKSTFNSLVLMDSKLNIIDKYDKNKLVPFGEFLPFESFLKKFGFKKVTEGYNSFSKSDTRKIMLVDEISILPLICYEIIYIGKLSKKKQNYDIIVNISEDGWFGDSIGPHQHFSKSIFRSIEEGKNIFRSSNNGISALINPIGYVEKKIESTNSGVISINSIKIIDKTLFSKFGNKIFFYFVLIYITLIFFLKRKDL